MIGIKIEPKALLGNGVLGTLCIHFNFQALH